MTANPDKAKLKPLAALFVAFPRQERAGTEDGLLDVYLMAVEDIAPDFVAMACKRFIAGQVERTSMTFRPTPPELAVEARRLQRHDEVLSRYDRLPSAPTTVAALPEPEVTPETRAKVGEEMRKLRQSLAVTEGHPVPLFVPSRKAPTGVKLSEAAKRHLAKVKAMNETESA